MSDLNERAVAGRLVECVDTGVQPARLDLAVFYHHKLAKYGWVFSLTERGELHVIVGDDLPQMPQFAIWPMLTWLAPELRFLLEDGTHGAVPRH